MVRESISFLRGKNQFRFTSELPEQLSDQDIEEVDLDLELIQELIDRLPEG